MLISKRVPYFVIYIFKVHNMIYEVTIAIPVYNVEKYINGTIKSVLSQTFTSIEILIIDDKGTDNSISIIQKIINKNPLNNKIRIIDNKINHGINYSRNVAIQEARGKYLFFLDADDRISPECIETLHKYIIKEKVEIVIGSYLKVDSEGNILSKNEYPQIISHKKDELATLRYGKLHKTLQTYTWNIMYDLNSLRNHDILFKEYIIGEDIIFWYDLYPLISSFAIIPDITYFYTIRSNSLSNFNKRGKIPLAEIKHQISVCKYENHNLKRYINKPFYNNMCINIMRYCLYCSLYIYKKKDNIYPPILNKKIFNELLYFPITLGEIIRNKNIKAEIIFFYLLNKSPLILKTLILKIIIKIKLE